MSWLAALLLAATLVTAAPGGETNQSGPWLLPVQGSLNDLTERELLQQLDLVAEGQTVVLKLDLDGAALTSSMRVAERLQQLPRGARSVAWIYGTARDGAALIALACDEIIIRSTVSLGPCTGLQRSHADQQRPDPLRDLFVQHATRHGQEPRAALGLLEPGFGAASYLGEEAVSAGLARLIVEDQAALEGYLGLGQALADRSASQWTQIASWLGGPLMRGLLLVLVLLGAYLELQNPGLRVPGAVAAIALLLFLAVPILSGAASSLELLLLVVGLALIAVEILALPGFGVAGIAGLFILAVGLLGTFVPPEPDAGWWPQRAATWDAVQHGMIVLMSSMVVGVAGIFLLAKYLPYSGLSRGLLPTEVGGAPLGVEPIPTQAGVGSVGVVTSELRSDGQAQFGEQIVEVASQGDFVESGTRVEVIARDGVQVVVRPVE